MSDDNIRGVRILDVIRDDRIKGALPTEFDTLPLYELVGEGILKENYGRRKSKEDILLFDVTNASDSLRETYAEFIEELEVKKIIHIRKPKGAAGFVPGNIVTLLPLDGIYQSLDGKEMKAVGHDFVTVTSTDEGIRLDSIVSAKTLPDNMHIRLHPTLDAELFAKLSNEIIELARKENGLYEDMGSISKDKEL